MHNNAKERTPSILNSDVLPNSTCITSPEVVDTKQAAGDDLSLLEQ